MNHFTTKFQVKNDTKMFLIKTKHDEETIHNGLFSWSIRTKTGHPKEFEEYIKDKFYGVKIEVEEINL